MQWFLMGFLDGLSDRAAGRDFNTATALSPDAMNYIDGYLVGYNLGPSLLIIAFIALLVTLSLLENVT